MVGGAFAEVSKRRFIGLVSRQVPDTLDGSIVDMDSQRMLEQVMVAIVSAGQSRYYSIGNGKQDAPLLWVQGIVLGRWWQWCVRHIERRAFSGHVLISLGVVVYRGGGEGEWMPVVVGPWNSNPGCPDGAIQEELRSCGVQLRRGDAKRFCDHSR